MKIVKNDLFDYEDRYIYQLDSTNKFSLDSVLLAEFVKVRNKNSMILDLCTGLAPIPLILSTKCDNLIFGIEIQKEIYDVSLKSLEINGLKNQIKLINEDINNISGNFKSASFDIITCNPPFFKVDNSKYVNVDKITKYSRHEYLLKLEDIFKISSNLLSSKGELYLVHRPERIDEIIILADKYNIRVKKINYVITNKKNNIKSVLVKCVKNSNFSVKTYVTDISDLKSYKNLFEGEEK